MVHAQTRQYYSSDKLALVSPTDKSKGIKLGEDISKAIQAFGQPTSVEDYPFETLGMMGKLYDFNGNKLYVTEGKLHSYHIFNSSILVGKINGTTFKVGDTIKSTRREIKNGPPGGPYHITYKDTYTFLDFPIVKEDGYSRNQHHYYYGVVFVLHNGIKYEASAHLYFDSNKKLFYISANLAD
ncbi:hypothetical protein DN752_04035 [Echinicola strongylocentroti]|uniref:Uncharacterized protein n=2 Tax=Echinicola strongylocentroti TaxID=1795355 RepID=A0A2Z4IFW3_9BACT|nr:hypothetical protein DN752_04035 [Echinicola strongylocentroti]